MTANKDPVLLTLRELLVQDHVIDPSDKGNVQVRCWMPGHNDSGPSMSVNPDKGVFNCFGCHVAGGAAKYLMTARGISEKEAKQMTRGTTRQTDGKKTWNHLPEGECQHIYRDENSEVFTVVIRRPKKIRGDPKVLPFRPVAEGKWKAELRRDKPHPLYRLPEILQADPNKMILVFEGEKCVDAWQKHTSNSCSTTFQGGSGNWGNTDFSPLYGRRVALIADEDQVGRDCMEALGAKLHQNGCLVMINLPEGETGKDVADWLEEGGMEYASQRVQELEKFVPTAAGSKKKVKTAAADLPEKDNKYFRMLGYGGQNNDQVMVLRVASTKGLMTIPVDKLTPGKMLSLAPLEYWTDKSSINRDCQHSNQSALIEQAYHLGRVNLSNIVGRGASRGEDGICFHFGDKVLQGEKEHDVDATHFKRYYPELDALPRKKPVDGYEKAFKPLSEAILDWNWLNTADGLMWLGWMAAALAGGALQWRPLLWVVGPAKSGKSFLQSVVSEWMGPYASKFDNFSNAAILREMASDSLLMMLDECEPTDLPKQLLASLRVTTDNTGKRIRASTSSDRDVVESDPRSCVYLSSVQLPDMKDTLTSRTIICRLTSADTVSPKEHMERLQKMLAAVRQHGETVRNFLLTQVPWMVNRTEHWAKALTDKEGAFGVRAAHVYAPVFAGLECLKMSDANCQLLLAHMQKQMEEEREVTPSTAVATLNALLAQELIIEVGGKVGSRRLARSLYDAAGDMEEEVKRRAADHGVVYELGNLYIDHNHPRLVKDVRARYAGGVSLRNISEQIGGIEFMRTSKGRRFGSRSVKNYLKLTEVALTHLGLEKPTQQAAFADDESWDETTRSTEEQIHFN